METMAYLHRCNLISHDIWLTNLSTEQQTHIFGAFAAALRQRDFSSPALKCLVAATVQEAVATLGKTFRANVGYNPSHGFGTRTLHPLLA